MKPLRHALFALFLCVAILAAPSIAAAAGPISTPSVPAQPNLANYPVSALNLFQTYTRTTYLAQFGVQAPAYNPSLPSRNWFDTSAAPGPYQGIQINPAGTAGSTLAQVVPLAVPANVALPNLSGIYQYPTYANLPATTPAIHVWGNGLPSTGVSVAYICSLADAQAVANSFGLLTLGEDPADGNVTWNGETRRDYTVTPKGGTMALEACPLRVLMTAQEFDSNGNYTGGGVGAPGSWTNPLGANPVWDLAFDPGASASSALTPVPVRSMLPNEQFAVGTLGTIEISRTDIAGPSNGSGGLTSAQQVYMYQILDALDKVYSLGIAPPQ